MNYFTVKLSLLAFICTYTGKTRMVFPSCAVGQTIMRQNVRMLTDERIIYSVHLNFRCLHQKSVIFVFL